jgi:hypothetical protein
MKEQTISINLSLVILVFAILTEAAGCGALLLCAEFPRIVEKESLITTVLPAA